MAIIILLDKNTPKKVVLDTVSNFTEEKIFLACYLPTESVVENVPNNQIDFPDFPNHIKKENKKRAEILANLNNLAESIEKSRNDLKIIPTLLEKDFNKIEPYLIANNISIKKIFNYVSA